MAAARRCIRDPGYARAYGIHRVESDLFAGECGYSELESWVRGAVVSMMPRDWVWRFERGVLAVTSTGSASA